MVEITLTKGAVKKVLTLPGGTIESFERGVPRYFSDGHPVIQVVKAEDERDMNSKFKIAQDIDQIPLPEDWAKMAMHDLRNILVLLNHDVGSMINHADYVKGIEKAIESGLVRVVASSDTKDQGLLTLKSENQQLRDQIKTMKSEYDKKFKALEDAFAEQLAEKQKSVEKLAGNVNAESGDEAEKSENAELPKSGRGRKSAK